MANNQDFLTACKTKRKFKVVKRFRRAALMILIWIFVAIYFLSSLSKVGVPKVSNNIYFTSNQIIDCSGLNHQKNKYIFDIDSRKVVELIKSCNPEFIIDGKVSKSIVGIKIKITEKFPVAIFEDQTYLFSSGEDRNLSQINEDYYQHLKNNPLGNILEKVPLIENKSEILDYQLLGTALASSDQELVINHLEKLVISTVNNKNKVDMTIFDSRLNNPSKTVSVYFDNISDISDFLNEKFYLKAINTFLNQSATTEFRYFFGEIVVR